VPFVQGRLRNEKISFVIETQCGHCQKPIRLEINSDMNYRVATAGAQPVIYAPMVDFDKLEDPSIIDGF
jgi:hypothetical protein